MSDGSFWHLSLRFLTPLSACVLNLTAIPRSAVAANAAPNAQGQALSAPHDTL